jgi:hypothetical protein
MSKPENRHHQQGADQKPGRKVGPAPTQQGAGPLVRGGDDADQSEHRDDLKKANHMPDYAGISFDREAAHVAREIAAFARLGATGAQVSGHEMLVTLARLIGAPASTPADALAFAVTARTLMPLVRESQNDDAMSCIVALIDRTVEVLEILSGATSEQFNGRGPAIN